MAKRFAKLSFIFERKVTNMEYYKTHTSPVFVRRFETSTTDKNKCVRIMIYTFTLGNALLPLSASRRQ